MDLMNVFQHVDRHRTPSLFVLAVVLIATVAVGCQTADPAPEASPIVVTGVPTGGGPVEDDVAHDLANLETALERPAVYTGNTVIGQATVYHVVSDRGFWLESGQRRIFTVIREGEPTTTDMAIERGQVLRLSGELHAADDVEAVAGEFGEALDQQTLSVLDDQQYFLVVSADTLEVITRDVAQR